MGFVIQRIVSRMIVLFAVTWMSAGCVGLIRNEIPESEPDTANSSNDNLWRRWPGSDSDAGEHQKDIKGKDETTSNNEDGGNSYLDLGSSGTAETRLDQARSQVSDDLVTILTSPDGDGWVRNHDVPQLGDEGNYRWRHESLDELLSRPLHWRVDWSPALKSDNTELVATARIGMNRQGLKGQQGWLVEIARTPSFSLNFRRAAIEALARFPVTDRDPNSILQMAKLNVLEDSSSVRIRLLKGLFNQFAQVEGPKMNHYQPKLHAELLWGLRYHKHPADDIRFVTALHSPSAEVRIAALQVWHTDQSGQLPSAAKVLVGDSNAKVRCAAVKAVAVSGQVHAVNVLKNSLLDHELMVRLVAIRALSQIADPQADPILEKLFQKSTGQTRAATIAALGLRGKHTVAHSAVEDSSWQVRRALAEVLEVDSDGKTADIAAKLLADRSSEVRRSMIQSLGRWPLESTGRILMPALPKLEPRLARLAISLLSERWTPAAEFNELLDRESYKTLIDKLQKKWQEDFGSFHTIADGASRVASGQLNSQGPAVAPMSPILADESTLEAIELLKQLALAEGREQQEQLQTQLISLGSSVVTAIEKSMFSDGQSITEDVYRLLPEVDPLFAEIQGLTDNDLERRRKSARRIALRARRDLLSELSLYRIGELAADESDPIVWQYLLVAIESDNRRVAEQIVLLSLSQKSSTVRRRGCKNLEMLARPHDVQKLTELLDDGDSMVVRSAAKALGNVEVMEDRQPLQNLLMSSNRSICIEAACSLVKLGDEMGATALERLCYDPHANTRRAAAEAIGQIADPAYVDSLIVLLDDHPMVRRVALEALPLVIGVDVTDQLPAESKDEAKAKHWKTWFEKRTK